MVNAIIANPQTIYDSYTAELQTLFSFCPQAQKLASAIFEKNHSSAPTLLSKLTFCEKQKNEDSFSSQSKIYTFAACLSLFYHQALGINQILKNYSIEHRPQKVFSNSIFSYLYALLFDQESTIDCESSFTTQDDDSYVFCQAATSYFAEQTLKNLTQSCSHIFRSQIPELELIKTDKLGTYFISVELGGKTLSTTSDKMRFFWTTHFKELFCKQTFNHPSCVENAPYPFSQHELAKLTLAVLCKRISRAVCLEAQAALDQLKN